MQATLEPTLSPYQRIGGDAAIRKLVDRFYELMDELPETYAARKIHPTDLTESGNKFFDFLSGWLGGPQRFVEKHGHPMLRRRHQASLGIECLNAPDWNYSFHRPPCAVIKHQPLVNAN